MSKKLTVSVMQVRKDFGKYLDRVLEGDTLVITRYNRPVAILMSSRLFRLEDIERDGER